MPTVMYRSRRLRNETNDLSMQDMQYQRQPSSLYGAGNDAPVRCPCSISVSGKPVRTEQPIHAIMTTDVKVGEKISGTDIGIIPVPADPLPDLRKKDRKRRGAY